MQRKIIIDTSWWIAFLVSKQAKGLPSFFFRDDIVFYFSKELSAEIQATLSYEHVSKRINEQNLLSFKFFEQELATFVNVNSIINAAAIQKIIFC